MESLLSGVGRAGSKSLLALKKRLSQVKDKNETVEPPLNKIQADKVRPLTVVMCVVLSNWWPL